MKTRTNRQPLNYNMVVYLFYTLIEYFAESMPDESAERTKERIVEELMKDTNIL